MICHVPTTSSNKGNKKSWPKQTSSERKKETGTGQQEQDRVFDLSHQVINAPCGPCAHDCTMSVCFIMITACIINVFFLCLSCQSSLPPSPRPPLSLTLTYQQRRSCVQRPSLELPKCARPSPFAGRHANNDDDIRSDLFNCSNDTSTITTTHNEKK